MKPMLTAFTYQDLTYLSLFIPGVHILYLYALTYLIQSAFIWHSLQLPTFLTWYGHILLTFKTLTFLCWCLLALLSVHITYLTHSRYLPHVIGAHTDILFAYLALTLSTLLTWHLFALLTWHSLNKVLAFLCWCSLALLGTCCLPNQLVLTYSQYLPYFSGTYTICFAYLALTHLTYLALTFFCWCSLALHAIAIHLFLLL